MTQWNKEWRKRNPEKVKAHWTVSNAIRYGKINKNPCEKCGNEKSHAHHADYSKPLEIKWLCHNCHWIEHGWVSKPKPPKEKGLRANNTNGRAPNAKWHKLKDKALTYRNKGDSYKDIADRLKVSQGTIYKWLNKTTYN